MEIILKTKKDETYLTTVFEEKTNNFKVIYLREGKASVLEVFKDCNALIETHDFWCKVVGLINKPFNKGEIEKYLQKIMSA